MIQAITQDGVAAGLVADCPPFSPLHHYPVCHIVHIISFCLYL